MKLSLSASPCRGRQEPLCRRSEYCRLRLGRANGAMKSAGQSHNLWLSGRAMRSAGPVSLWASDEVRRSVPQALVERVRLGSWQHSVGDGEMRKGELY